MLTRTWRQGQGQGQGHSKIYQGQGQGLETLARPRPRPRTWHISKTKAKAKDWRLNSRPRPRTWYKSRGQGQGLEVKTEDQGVFSIQRRQTIINAWQVITNLRLITFFIKKYTYTKLSYKICKRLSIAFLLRQPWMIWNRRKRCVHMVYYSCPFLLWLYY